MIPYNPNSPMALWYLAWRNFIRNAKQRPQDALGYTNAAVMAQAQYVMYLALEMAGRAHERRTGY